MLEVNSKKKLHNILFWLAYIMIIFETMMSRITSLSSTLQLINKLYIIILIASFILSIDNIKSKQIIKPLFMLILPIIVYIKSNDSSILKLMLLLVAANGIDFDNFIKKDFKIKLVLIICVLVCHYLNLTNDYIMYRSDGTIRNSMGFSHPNILGLYLLSLGMEYVYIYKNKLNLKIFILLILITSFTGFYLDSRSSIICTYLLFIYIIFKKQINKIIDLKLSKYINSYLFILITILVYIITIKYSQGDNLARTINNLTSNRIYSINIFLKEYGINLFGHNLYLISTEQAIALNTKAYILDCSYFNILIRYGFITYLTIFIIFKKMIMTCYNQKNKTLIVILLIFMIYGIMETGMFKISYNPFLLFYSTILFNNKKEQSVNEKY